MNNLIRDAHFQQVLKEDGVVKVPFLNQEELNAVLNLYKEIHGENSPPTLYNGIHMTIWHHDYEYKKKIQQELEKIVDAATGRTFEKHRAISHQFIVKLNVNETDTTFPVHQDWSIVDEHKYESLNLWIPLQDVDENNGAMWIVKGSHKINRKVRGAGHLFPNYRPVFDQLKPYISSFPMKAGEALLFYHSTIHGSPKNQSKEARAVVQISILPEKAPLQIFFQKSPESPLEVHFPEDDFVFRYNRIREDSEVIPPTPVAAEIKEPFKQKEVTMSEMIEIIENKIR